MQAGLGAVGAAPLDEIFWAGGGEGTFGAAMAMENNVSQVCRPTTPSLGPVFPPGNVAFLNALTPWSVLRPNIPSMTKGFPSAPRYPRAFNLRCSSFTSSPTTPICKFLLNVDVLIIIPPSYYNIYIFSVIFN